MARIANTLETVGSQTGLYTSLDPQRLNAVLYCAAALLGSSILLRPAQSDSVKLNTVHLRIPGVLGVFSAAIQQNPLHHASRLSHYQIKLTHQRVSCIALCFYVEILLMTKRSIDEGSEIRGCIYERHIHDRNLGVYHCSRSTFGMSP